MVISSLHVGYWKNFKEVDAPLSGRTFIVGANAAGKSNLLDTLRFLRDLAKPQGGLQYAVEQRFGVPRIRSLFARGNALAVEVGAELSESVGEDPVWRYRLQFANAGGGFRESVAKVVLEEVTDLRTMRTVLSRHEKTEGEDSVTLGYSHLENPVQNREFRPVFELFASIQYLHVVPQLLRDSDSYKMAPGKEDFFGKNLLKRMITLNEKTREAYFRRINEALKIAVPQFENLRLDDSDRQEGLHLKAIFKHWRGFGAGQTERDFSDGTLRLIGLLWALQDGQGPLLLEEPELYLNAGIVRQIPEMIAQIRREKEGARQIIVTTHSLDLLNNPGIAPEEVLVLEVGQDGTSVTRAADLHSIQGLLGAGATVGDAIAPVVTPLNLTGMLETPYSGDLA